jgi:predicted ester cyclase
MSASANKFLVRRFIEEVVNTGDVSRVREFIAPNYVNHYEQSGKLNGVEGMVGHVRDVRGTYPDLHVTVQQQVAEGDWVATRVIIRGTHRGRWLGLTPTGRPLEIVGMNLDRVVDGRMVEHWGVANTLEALIAIGALQFREPDPGTT